MYCAYKWLLTYKANNWKGDASTERSGPLALPQPLPLSTSAISETRRKRANYLLQKTLLERIILSWKAYNRRIRRGLTALKVKQLRPVFTAWIE